MKFLWSFDGSDKAKSARIGAPVLAEGFRWSRRLIPRTLIARVFALYSLTLLVFTSLAVGVFLLHETKQQLDDPQRDAVAMVELVLHSLTDSVVIGDYDTVRQTLAGSVDGSLFSKASFIDLHGGYITLESPKWSSAPAGGLGTPHWVLAWVQARLYDVNRVVSVGGRDYGVLRLHYDAQKVATGIWSVSSLAVLFSLICLMACMLVTYVCLNRWLRSLDHLRLMEQPLQLGQPEANEPIDADAPIEIRRVQEMFNRIATLVREREATRKALDRQKFALDQHAIVSIADEQGTITYANDRLCAISGYGRAQLIGANHRLLKSGHQDASVYQAMWRDICAGLVWHGDLCNQSQSGQTYWVNATIVPLTAVDGEPLQFISIQTDITDRKRIEASLAEAKDAAEHANRAKSEFLANMSHEIRTPLNAILGMVTLMKTTELSVRQKDYSEKIDAAARSFLGLVNDILDFSKVEAGKLELDPRPFTMEAFLRGLAGILAGNVVDKTIEVMFDIDPDVPTHWVGDDQRLLQVLINLCGNAIKFTESGEVIFRLGVVSQGIGVATLRFEVEDTGIGIEADKLAMIFEGFSQAEASTTRRFGGSGLGLAISRRLVQLMGGELRVDSTLGKGSRFFFDVKMHMPFQEPDAPPSIYPQGSVKALVLQGVSSLNDASSGLVDQLSGMTVLVVEDNANNQQVVTELLAAQGATVTVADNGADALEIIGKASPQFDVVLMDIQMPVMDGYTATRHIRNLLTAEELPIIAMTANVMPADKVKSAQAGMNDHVGKPFDIQHLVAVLQRYKLPSSPSLQPCDQTSCVTSSGDAALERLGDAVREAALAAGVDIDDAWTRMGGRMDIHAHMLAGFVRDLKAMFDLSAQGAMLTPDISQKDVFSDSQLHRTLHTLKGSAGMLSATPLAAHLAVEEKKLIDEGLGTDRQAMVSRLRLTFQGKVAPFQALLDVMTPLYARPVVKVKQSDTSAKDLQAMLHHLVQLLDGADMEACAVYERLQAQGVTGSSAIWADLQQAMDALSFERAALCCRALLDGTLS